MHSGWDPQHCREGHQNLQNDNPIMLPGSVADPDLNPDPYPPDPYVFGPPGSGSFYNHAKIVRKALILTIL
jgi:hypothetical protein